MAITETAPDPDIKAALRRGLSDFLDPNDQRGRRMADAKSGLKVSILTLQDILDGAQLEGVHDVGWGIIVGDPGGSAAAAQVTQSGGGGWELTSFSEGAEISGLIQSIKKLDDLPEVQRNEYEVGILRIPGVLIEALWLKSKPPIPDLIVPFHTLSHQIQAHHPYSPKEFLDAVRPIAVECKEFDNLYQ